MHAIKEGIFWFLGVELEVKDEVEVMVELEVELEEGSIQKHEIHAMNALLDPPPKCSCKITYFVRRLERLIMVRTRNAPLCSVNFQKECYKN